MHPIQSRPDFPTTLPREIQGLTLFHVKQHGCWQEAALLFLRLPGSSIVQRDREVKSLFAQHAEYGSIRDSLGTLCLAAARYMSAGLDVDLPGA